jgi:lambda repressor-like predicted transcriptional regulator
MNALSSANRAELIIGGATSEGDEALILYRGDLERIVVPFKWFSVGSTSPEPDFRQLAVTDGGQTVRLGDYEAAVDAILYEFDPQYRRRAKKRLAEKDDSLGGALRRLRLQKGLRQNDFASVGAKVIARIERGEVKKPHQKTMTLIAKRLGVSPEEIGTF